MHTAAAEPDVLPRSGAAPRLDGRSHPRRARRRWTVAAAAVLAVSVALAVAAGTGSDRLRTPATTPAEAADGLVVDGRDRGFLRTVGDRSDGPTLVLDRAVLLSGDAADAEAAARGHESPVPNDVMVVNDDPQLREYPVDPDAAVHLSVGLAPAEVVDVPVASSLTELRGLLPPPSSEPISGYLFDVVVEDGVVVALDHVYVP